MRQHPNLAEATWIAAIALVSTASCVFVAMTTGSTLGALLACLVLAMFVSIPIAMGERTVPRTSASIAVQLATPAMSVRRARRSGIARSVISFTTGMLPILVLAGWACADVEFPAAFACGAIIVAFAFALVVIAVTLCRMKLDPATSGAIAIALGLAWLFWPIFLLPTMMSNGVAEPTIDKLTAASPLFAIDGQVADRMGIWTQQPVTYKLQGLGQDVSYRMPRSAWISIGTHVLAAGALLLLAHLAGKLKFRRKPTGITEAVEPAATAHG